MFQSTPRMIYREDDTKIHTPKKMEVYFNEIIFLSQFWRLIFQMNEKKLLNLHVNYFSTLDFTVVNIVVVAVECLLSIVH